MPEPDSTEKFAMSWANRTCGMACQAIVVLLLLPFGCVGVMPGPVFKVVLQDAVTGEELEDCLMVTRVEAGRWLEWPWLRLLAHSYGDKFHTICADIDRVKSGETVIEGPVFRICYPSGVFTYTTRDKRYMYTFYKDGYAPAKHTGPTINRSHWGGRLIVKLRPESDKLAPLYVYDEAQMAVDDALPRIPESNPLRRELLQLLAKQIERACRNQPGSTELLQKIRVQILPDLQGLWFDASPKPLAAGDAFTVTFAVENIGAQTAGAFRVDFYVSTDSTISPADRLLGSYTTGTVPASSGTGALNKGLTLPAAGDPFWTGDGRYHLGMIVDAGGAVVEASKNNNKNRGSTLDQDAVQVNYTRIR